MLGAASTKMQLNTDTVHTQTVAEQAAWDVATRNGIHMCSILPTFVLGPVISSRTDATSVQTVKVGSTD